MKESNIYCIIITYNGLKWISSALESIRNSSVQLKTIVVDNGSSDGSLELINSEFPEIHIHNNNKNLGFGKANNLGVKMAIEEGADYVFLLNQDAYLQDDSVEKCLDLFHSNKQVGLVSPVHLNGQGTELDFGFQSCITPRLCPGYISDLVLGNLKSSYPIYSVNAAAWFIKVSVIKEIGLFSPAFFHYGEDINFQQRLWYKGFEAYLAPKAFILHDREERNGEKSAVGKKHEIKTNQMVLLLNIQEPYSRVIKRVIKYSGLLFFEGKILQGLQILFDTLFNYRKYRVIREDLKQGIPL